LRHLSFLSSIFPCYGDHRDLHSFPTRRSSDLASISNDNLQDLKTGWLVGATPWRQQVALLIGCVVGAAVISPVLELLYNAYGFRSEEHTSELQSRENLVCRLLHEKKKNRKKKK